MMTELASDKLQDILDRKAQLEISTEVNQILDVLFSLFDVEMTTADLQATLIGHTVNLLRHDESVGTVAQCLIRKWKNIIIDEMEGGESCSDSDEVSCDSDSNRSEPSNTDSVSCDCDSCPSKLHDRRSNLLKICTKATPLVKLIRVDAQKLPAIMNTDNQEGKVINQVQDAEASGSGLLESECPAVTYPSSKPEVKNCAKFALVEVKRYIGPKRLILKSPRGKGKKSLSKCCNNPDSPNTQKRLCPEVK